MWRIYSNPDPHGVESCKKLKQRCPKLTYGYINRAYHRITKKIQYVFFKYIEGMVVYWLGAFLWDSGMLLCFTSWLGNVLLLSNIMFTMLFYSWCKISWKWINDLKRKRLSSLVINVTICAQSWYLPLHWEFIFRNNECLKMGYFFTTSSGGFLRIATEVADAIMDS
jgi:hypothetical protein